MLNDVQTFELYYDSEEPEPREDPEAIHDRLQAIAEANGVDYDRIDTAEMSDTEREEAYESAVAKLLPDREYHVGNRIFTGSLFGGARPALLIHYEEGIDLYPHRNDALGSRPVGILDLLDELQADRDTDHSDYAAIRDMGEDEDAGQSRTEAEQETETAVIQDVTTKLRHVLPV